MTPQALLDELSRRQVELLVDGSWLRFRPGRAVPPRLRAEMAARKQELISLIKAGPHVRPPSRWAKQASDVLAGVADDEHRADLRYRFEERAAVGEFCGNLTQDEAEHEALKSLQQVVRGMADGVPGAPSGGGDATSMAGAHGVGHTARAVPGPLKWHGGKHYLSRRIVDLMPPHTHYVEPFAGGLSVLLAKDPEGVAEVVNDLDHRLTNFWRVLRDPDAFGRFLRHVEATPFSQREWEEADAPAAAAEPWEQAARFFMRCRMSLAGRQRSFAPLSKTRRRRGMNEQVSAWISAVEGLPAVHERLRRVVILNRPALDVIESQDSPGTVFYLDPPYHPEARASPAAYGAYEMSAEQHAELLAVATSCQGRVLLSGYDCELYRRELAGWRRHEFDVPNHAAGGGQKRRMKEIVWANFT